MCLTDEFKDEFWRWIKKMNAYNIKVGTCNVLFIFISK